MPIFTNDYGVTIAGPAMPPIQQLGAGEQRVEVKLEPPEQLIAGHAVIELQLEYECGDTKVFEMTSPVGFVLLERSEAPTPSGPTLQDR